ncbi:class I SAM-dependent DNA methyltransferase [Pseudomonas oryzihabitans]|uniref:class I SAM-dependent DNA methyltransferase n=1 Tax=Pseudomonas oryzihabitans TaxID=47885 RepID=UPI0014761862|nr:class I SAM-dependent DNA methyltransferase [Pseudomonas oryzihabitans]NMZ66185.1 class I SAM-dependent DNA methyltransferase [Pseudomonas oryzihabitans]
MNAVEIEQAITDLASRPFDPVEFPYAFLQAFGNKETTLKRLRSGSTNKSDLGGVLQTSNIHLAVCEPGKVTETLAVLKASPATARAKAKYVLATDGETLEAEELESGETVACDYHQFPDHFGFFLPLAGISTVKQIRENSFDIRATSRLNRLYVELLKDNPTWGTAERRHEMNHFMARLIFCFFAEDTDIFNGTGLFTDTLTQMSDRDASNLHEVMGEIFRAMNTPIAQRASANLPRWADAFPYVNGGLFSGEPDVPRFSRIARSYLLHIGALDWKQINPDIFGSMIQAVADDEERGALGMHYTSVPNILKVLNPLFLDELRAKLEEAGDNPRMLLNMRKRLARIRIFDPACGSGNFLVIAYKQLREIENMINERRGEPERKSDIPLTNFRGIELRNFSAEIARLALIIAEYQCDVVYRGQKEALLEFLPLSSKNWITCGNALRLNWLQLMDEYGTGVKLQSDDLFGSPLQQAQIDFEHEGGETYICGNPPYKGAREQLPEQKDDLRRIFDGLVKDWKSLDYVAGWFMKAAEYGEYTNAVTAFVSTNSICQGQSVPILWPYILGNGHEIKFAHTSFKWSNLASNNAGVTVAIIGISKKAARAKKLFSLTDEGATVKEVEYINAYLVAGANVIVSKRSMSISGLSEMSYGNYPGDGNYLTLSSNERTALERSRPDLKKIIRPVYGAQEFIKGLSRYCLWIDNEDLELALSEPSVAQRIDAVRTTRLASRDGSLNKLAVRSHQYRDRNVAIENLILVPTVSSERREYFPTELKRAAAVTTNQAFALYDAPLWNMALIASKMHLVWIATVCGKMKTDFRYSNTLGWNTFPVPALTEKNRVDLTRCAEDILLARESHFPATIAELYDPETMPDNLRAAHERNDEVLERIYIGRCFKNDTERLEKLFELYIEMTDKQRLRKAKQ